MATTLPRGTESRICSFAGSQDLYVRHRPEQTPLYAIVEQHAHRFFATLREHGAWLPRFVHAEFEHYLRCGRLEEGFIRVKCTGCRHEHLVAFSCKRRGLCPSCGARRMVETAAHLIDNVLPAVPVRQWVLSFPWPLRFVFATRPALLTRVLGIVTRALSTFLVRRAGLTVGSGAQTGMVTLIKRFGSALNLNVHLHILALDGAYSFERERPRFRRTPAPSRIELERLLATLIRRITRTLVRAGALVAEDEQSYLDLDEGGALEQLEAAAVRYRIAVGPQAGQRTVTLGATGAGAGDSTPPSKPQTAARDGFSLNAAVACEAYEKAKLERLCRYIARAPIANHRLGTNAAGQVVYELKQPYRDGTSHVVFDPLDFIARLAALVPRPHANLTRYHGVFAPRARHRHRVVPPGRVDDRPRLDADESDPASSRPRQPSPMQPESKPSRARRSSPLSWMQRLKRVFAIDLSRCPWCGGQLRPIGELTDPRVIDHILAHLAWPEPGPAPRGPPIAGAGAR